MPRTPGHPALAELGTTVFATMTQLALEKDAVNLGQGFPDTDGPREVLDAAVEAIRSGRNQYPPGAGYPELRAAVAAHQERFYGLRLDPAREVLVTVGATEAIAAAVLALVRPGEEVVTFEPYYDSYAATIALAGGVRRTSLLRFPDFAVDEASLRAAFSPRTSMVLLNTPHNPTGRVFSREELELVAELAREYDAWVVTDEVYEHLAFDGRRHVPIATLPGMAERTVTISSGGKTFATTGWKVGWLSGPAEAVAAARAVKQFLTFVGSGPFQPAVAAGLGLPDAVFERLAASMAGKRDRLVSGLRTAGFEVPVPEGGYFVLADAAPLGVQDAVQLCFDLPDLAGVVGVPASAFHDSPRSAPTLVRFAFCKEDAVLDEGCRRLARLRGA
ncbi:pyridoxal phosphate-dependent aminotransferase [Phycicoccus endophyticus]|uniref:Pyridoxal phosphate-dependent aminotransferase n=1 Tax=Phycicoccus endophyticus TaxID=1690220 RepID=A0A7G9QY73_9MICO|nr:pyridoxal phosphate-dependent aminotransferase [Phycicoccus endophyticus]NHI19185.1 pyridoxal phosphate-dependent aminotransferase [Phycicoccus endophyticus]QNN48298.1 pyridoxal phosphate-dependent aminotransferase [Phycicoccus endophyticus]GGL40842.1 aminotransferase [Phycicoccus endophyticus]